MNLSMAAQPITSAGSAGKQPNHAQVKVGIALLLGVLAITVESSAGMGHAQTAVWVRMVLGSHLSGGGVETLNAFLRKCGHVTGFGMLGLIGERTVRTVLKRATPLQVQVHQSWLTASGGVVLACFIGICDEIHQSFLPTRHGAASDVVLDTVGAVAFLAGSAYFHSKTRLQSAPPTLCLIPVPAAAM